MLLILDGIIFSLVIGLRSSNAFDYYNYLVEYNEAPTIPFSSADFPGYNILMRFCINSGLQFNQFVLLVTILSVFMMLFGMFKLSKYVPFALSLFIIYPFGHEAIQMRTFLANAMVWFALPLLLIDHSDKRKNFFCKFLFFIITYIATTIHTLSWFYFMIGIIYLIVRNLKRYHLFFITGFIVLFILIHTGFIDSFVSSNLSSDKLEHWVEGTTRYGWIIYSIITIFIYLLIRYAIRYMSQAKNNQTAFRIKINILYFSEFIIFLIPLFSYDITFNRLWRIFLGLLYLISGEFLYNKQIKHGKLMYGITLFTVLFLIFCIENEFSVLNSFLR